MSDLGTMENHGDHVVLRYERRVAHPVERVWAALTDPDELVRWWGRVQAPRLAAGEPYTITWLNEGEAGETIVMEATITEIRERELLEVRGDPHGTVRFELRADGDATELLLQCTSPVPPEHRTSVQAGWHFHLDALARALDGGHTDLAHPEKEWAPIHDRYAGLARR
jgi:uncharacterized protein YndB with AHSA1/START domain